MGDDNHEVGLWIKVDFALSISWFSECNFLSYVNVVNYIHVMNTHKESERERENERETDRQTEIETETERQTRETMKWIVLYLNCALRKIYHYYHN